MESARGHVFTDPDHGVIAGVFQARGIQKALRFIKVVFMTSDYREDRPGKNLVFGRDPELATWARANNKPSLLFTVPMETTS